MRVKLKVLLIPVIVPVAVVLVWLFAARRIGNPVILPPIDTVVNLLASPTDDLISMGSLVGNVGVSLIRVLMGYLLAAAVGIPLGVLMGYYALVFRLMNTFVNVFRPIPPLAWVPLVMAWFGVASLATVFGVETGKLYIYLNNLKFSMIFIIFIGGFYPVLSSSKRQARCLRFYRPDQFAKPTRPKTARISAPWTGSI